MFKNISSRTLTIVFVVLLALAAFYIYYDSSHEERSFKKNIVDIDTAKVTAISIYPKANNHKEVRLFKEGKEWQVQLENNKSVPAQQSKVKNLLNQLAGIKSTGVVAQNENKWHEFQVDTVGTRVKVFEGNDNTLDITFGKFNYEQQTRSMSTAVRINDDDNVYNVNGFLEFSFNQKPNAFRDNYIVNDDMSHWNKLTFTYPDSSFQLVKDTSNHWTINGIRTDSATTVSFLRSLSHITGSNFIDNPDQSLLNKSNYTLTIQSTGFGAIDVSGFGTPSTKTKNPPQFIIHSSQNDESYFNGNSGKLWTRVFVSKKHFFPSKKKKK